MARTAVALAQCYRLLNHGPTVLVSAAHGGRRNVMAAAWNMALDFSPPKVAVVLDKSTFTRSLVEASGAFVLNVPCAAQAAMVNAVGNRSGREVDKAARIAGVAYADGTATEAPLVEGCVAWLECRRIAEPHVEQTYDLFLGEVLAAWADERVYSHGRWHFEGHDALRTLHHVAGGNFLLPGAWVQA